MYKRTKYYKKMEQELKIKQSQGHSRGSWVTDSMKKLENHMIDETINGNFKMDIGLVSCGYHYTKEQLSQFGGAIGYTGCSYPGMVQSKDPENIQMFNLEIKCNPDIDAEKIRAWSNSFTLTPSGNDRPTYKPLNIYSKYNYENKNVTDYYYKKEGFDEAYKAFSKMDPSYTEKDFASIDLDSEYDSHKYNERLIEKTSIKRNNEEAFDIKEYQACVREDNMKYYDVIITLLSTDIDRENNLSILMEILKYCSQNKYIKQEL